MPTEAEIRVLEMLDAVDLPSEVARRIQEMGNEAVTVLCEAALGSFPELRPKARFNAVAWLGLLDHPQAREAINVLINDSNPDISIRAIRAVGRKQDQAATQKLANILNRSESSYLVVAEALKALMAIGSEEALDAVERYRSTEAASSHHRGTRLIADILRQKQ